MDFFNKLENLGKNFNPYLLFLPFLGLYILLIFIGHSDVMEGDEGRYYEFAENLLNGFYSSPPPNINLWNGPGYPIILIPFVWLNLPFVYITLLNGAFQYLSIVLLFLSLMRFVNFRGSFFLTIFWGLYYVAFKEMTLIYTESFATFLTAALIYIATKRNLRIRDILWGGIIFGFLILTKIIFGYALLFLLLATFTHYTFGKKKEVLNLVGMFLIALLINVPYLFYTYSLTGKAFYWGNSGGMSLYWMSSPYKHEYGDWNTPEFDAYCFDTSLPCNSELFSKNHKADIEYVLSLPITKQDDAYKDLALKNIKENPLKFLKNCYANGLRMLFNFPESYTYPREMSLLRIPPNSFLFTLMIVAFVLTFLNWRLIPERILYIIAFLFLYLGASILVSATHRQFNIVVPVILFWIGFIFQKSISLKFISTRSGKQ